MADYEGLIEGIKANNFIIVGRVGMDFFTHPSEATEEAEEMMVGMGGRDICTKRKPTSTSRAEIFLRPPNRMICMLRLTRWQQSWTGKSSNTRKNTEATNRCLKATTSCTTGSLR